MTSDQRISMIRHWSLDTGYCSTDLPADSVPTLPHDIGKEDFGFSDLGAGCNVIHYQGVAYHRLCNRITVDAGEPLLIIRAPLIGRSDFAFRGVGSITESPERIGLFVHGNPEDPCTSEHAAHDRMSVAAIMITASRLHAMCAGIDLPPPLRDVDPCRAANAMADLTMSAAKRQLFGDLVSHSYSGALARLHSEGKVLEIVAAILADLGGREDCTAGPPVGMRAKVETACEYLLSRLSDVPAQEMLAREVGLTQRQLANAFRQTTGKTMTEWILEKKMVKAAEMLIDGDLAVKEIAWRLGYSHISTFTAAFSSQYGIPPAGYRRGIASHHAVIGIGRGN